jgi:hypothetical protein
MFLEYVNKQPDKMQKRNCSSVHPTSLAPPATLGSSGPQTLEVRFPRLLYFSTYTYFISKRTHQTTRARGPGATQFKLAQAAGITTCVLLWIGSPPVGDLRLNPYEFKKRRAIQQALVGAQSHEVWSKLRSRTPSLVRLNEPSIGVTVIMLYCFDIGLSTI